LAAQHRTALERRRRIAAWVAGQVMPHEGFVRACLVRARVSAEDVDELIQDCYCRFAMLDAVDHVASPQAYFLSTARNLLVRRLQRARIVPIEAIADLGELCADDAPSPEREAAGRLDYARLKALMAALPERCRRIVEMRKFEGWSQKEIASRMGVTENVVENDVQQGVKAILRAWRAAEAEAQARWTDAAEGKGKRA
jgi:RNA polymerase sigma factor (sigma-70 family)